MSQYNEGSNNPYYGNASGGGGGGYLTGGSPFGSASGSPGGAERRSALSQSLRPVSIKQLHDATQPHSEAPWTIEEKDIGHISLVGQVVTVRPQATNIVYWLDDGTGRIEARHWHDQTSDGGSKAPAVEADSWLRVTGLLKIYHGKRHLTALNIRPVTDANEIWFHLTEVITVTLTFERGTATPAAPALTTGGSAAVYAAPAQRGGNDPYAHLQPVERSIVEYIRNQPPNDDGYHITRISQNVTASAEEFGNALERLLEDGSIFTTLGDTHVALAE